MSLQCISSLTDVDTGTEILLLDAWHVRIVWRSSLLRWFSLNSLVTLIFPKILPSDSISSDTSSSKAWSLHQVTLGVGRPDTNWNLITETVRCGIVIYYYWMFITYNAIILVCPKSCHGKIFLWYHNWSRFVSASSQNFFNLITISY